MDTFVIGLVIGFLVAAAMWIYWRGRRRRGDDGAAARAVVRSSVEGLRAVGELVVLKVFTQQIVTQTDHLFGNWGEKWLAWLVSSKKTAMIFDFVVDFRYDLKSQRFVPEIVGEDRVHFTLPACFYEIQLKDIRIYDERAAAVVPILLPEWLGQIFGGKFSEHEKNMLIRAARQEAEGLARQLATRMIGEVQHSAETTLRMIARAMGFVDASFKFSDETSVQGAVDVTPVARKAEQAVTE